MWGTSSNPKTRWDTAVDKNLILGSKETKSPKQSNLDQGKYLVGREGQPYGCRELGTWKEADRAGVAHGCAETPCFPFHLGQALCWHFDSYQHVCSFPHSWRRGESSWETALSCKKMSLSEALAWPWWIAREILMTAFTKQDANGPELQLIFPELWW